MIRAAAWRPLAGLLAAWLTACANLSSGPPTSGSSTAPSTAQGGDTPSGSMPGRTPASGWELVRLPGKQVTAYQRDLKDGRRCWRADAERSAAMFRHRVNVAGADLAAVRFSWWVDRLVPGADLREAGLGDAPARVVFAFEGDHARLSLRNRMLFELAGQLTGETPPYATLMYVWANEGPVDSVIVHPRTDRVRKIVLESGPAHLRQWRHYQRDLAADFQRAFGESPGRLVGIGLMTDTDNLQGSARTWYGDIEWIHHPAAGGQLGS